MFLVYAFICIYVSYAASETVENVAPKFQPPTVPQSAYMCMYFQSPFDYARFVISTAKKEGIDESLAKYDGKWAVQVSPSSAIRDDYSLMLLSAGKHHAIAYKFDRTFAFDTDEFVFQYEVKFDEELQCSGAYVKLLNSPESLENFNDQTSYSIMFGPDKCGPDEKLHFIIRYKNPKSGIIEEKHAKQPKASLSEYFKVGRSHLYTLVIDSSNEFEIYVDQQLVNKGNLLEDFVPPINPAKEISDPNDVKPEDWDDNKMIPDSDAPREPEFIIDDSAIKPVDWLDDEPAMIPNPNSENHDMESQVESDSVPELIPNPKCEEVSGCGEWVPPTIANPNFKGESAVKMIDNPNYNGTWEARIIPNPHFFEDLEPFRNLIPINSLGIELWSMSEKIGFDNFLLVDSKEVADQFAQETFVIKQKAEKRADTGAKSVYDAAKETFEEKPWLVIGLGVLFVLPIVICCVYFCRSNPEVVDHHKKTDAVTPDDAVVEEEETNESSGEAEDKLDDNNCELIDDPNESPEQKCSVGPVGDSAGHRSASDADSASQDEEVDITTARLRPRKF